MCLWRAEPVSSEPVSSNCTFTIPSWSMRSARLSPQPRILAYACRVPPLYSPAKARPRVPCLTRPLIRGPLRSLTCPWLGPQRSHCFERADEQRRAVSLVWYVLAATLRELIGACKRDPGSQPNQRNMDSAQRLSVHAMHKLK